MNKKIWLPLLAVLVTAIFIALYAYLVQDPIKSSRKQSDRVVPVEVAEIERGAIELRRTFTGEVAAMAEFVVAPKVSGRIEELTVDLADSVDRGQVVARLDHDEYVQAVLQAEADLAVAEANLAEAKSLLKLAEREFKRVKDLRKRGVATESELDAAQAEQLARQAHLEVTRAQRERARAQLETARIRLGYTEVTADWRGESQAPRIVAARYVNEGQTVSANTELLRIVELDPVKVVFYVTEKNYAKLQPGQAVALKTDAYPDKVFSGEISRIAPVFEESTRQALVELRVANPARLLKPGMFVRAGVVLDRVEAATIVPERSLIRRDNRNGVFIVNQDGNQVSWHVVQVGIRDGKRVQLVNQISGNRVVILGQHLLDDKSGISITNAAGDAAQ